MHHEQERLEYLEDVTVELYLRPGEENVWAALASLAENLLAHEASTAKQVNEIADEWLGGRTGIASHEIEIAIMPVHDRGSFENLYAGQPRWEIGRPQKAIIDVADRISGSLLDAGCGTGENALFFARRGCQVTGIDFLAEPITLAKRKAAQRRLTATFLVMDALAIRELPERFDNAIDSGLFHVFSDDDRRRYVDAMATVLKPGGRLYLLCFSDEEPGNQGPRRVSRNEIADAFAHGWTIESVDPARYEVRPDPNDRSFRDGGPKAWFVVAMRLPAP